MLQQEEVFDTDSDGYWYDNDLQLAAELGKHLLERNRELESQLRQSQQWQGDKEREIELLSKQLEVVRSVNESRMRIYEEVDRNAQELERTLLQVQQESKGDKDKIRGLTDTIDTLENRCDELQSKMEGLQKEERRKKVMERRTLSVPSLIDNVDIKPLPRSHLKNSLEHLRSLPYLDVEDYIALREMLRKTSAKLEMEQRKKNEYETDVASLVLENQSLEKRVRELEREKQRACSLEMELQALEINAGKLCKECKGKVDPDPLCIPTELAVEHDIHDIPRGQLMRLKNGGSAYGSRESLTTLGMEPDLDASNASFSFNEGRTSPASESSILEELEVQYKTLMHRYEKLVEAKSKREAEDKAVQSNSSEMVAIQKPDTLLMNLKTNPKPGPPLDLTSPQDPTEGHFDHGPPEYKKLFKEIFQTLRRSATFEEDQQNTPPSTS